MTSRRAGAWTRLVVGCACVVALAPHYGWTAAPQPAAAAEVEFLLSAIGNSGCDFLRNGTWHGGQQAQAHLSAKYRWLMARDRITTAEDFINLAATHSSVTGQAYAVRCPGLTPVSSNSWLEAQLHRYREASSP